MTAVGASMSGLRRWQIDPGSDAVGDGSRTDTPSGLPLTRSDIRQAAWRRHSQSINPAEVLQKLRPPPIQRRRANNPPPSLEEGTQIPCYAGNARSIVGKILRCGRTSPSALHPHSCSSSSICPAKSPTDSGSSAMLSSVSGSPSRNSCLTRVFHVPAGMICPIWSNSFARCR